MKTPDIIIAHPGNEDKFDALMAFMKALKIKFEIAKKDASTDSASPYNAEFVAKIQESREQHKAGDFSVIKTEDLWK